jgi:hypothetical protein
VAPGRAEKVQQRHEERQEPRLRRAHHRDGAGDHHTDLQGVEEGDRQQLVHLPLVAGELVEHAPEWVGREELRGGGRCTGGVGCRQGGRVGGREAV